MKRISVFPANTAYKKLNQNADADQRNITPIEGAKAGAITGRTTGGLLVLTAGLGTLVIPIVSQKLVGGKVDGTNLAFSSSDVYSCSV